MKLILRLLLTAAAVLLLSKILSGVYVEDYLTAIWVAIVLGLLNFIVRPILIVLTLPVTLITFGLFLLVINALVILLASNLVDGFSVASVWWAILFSILLSIFQAILFSMLKESKG